MNPDIAISVVMTLIVAATPILLAGLGELVAEKSGVLIGGLVLATSYIGADIAQTAAGLPQAATGLIQALMLFFLLAVDILVGNRLRLTGRLPAQSSV